MRRLNPILNDGDNLCKISKTMNQNKRRSDPIDAVKNYMKAMEESMQRVIDAIRAIATELENLEHEVTAFANLLVKDFNAKYGLDLS